MAVQPASVVLSNSTPFDARYCAISNLFFRAANIRGVCCFPLPSAEKLISSFSSSIKILTAFKSLFPMAFKSWKFPTAFESWIKKSSDLSVTENTHTFVSIWFASIPHHSHQTPIISQHEILCAMIAMPKKQGIGRNRKCFYIISNSMLFRLWNGRIRFQKLC